MEDKDRKQSRSAVLSSRPDYQELGEWLRGLRIEAGFEQKPLSRLLGKPDQFIHKVESGKQRIDLVEFRDLLRLLRVDAGVALQFLTSKK